MKGTTLATITVIIALLAINAAYGAELCPSYTDKPYMDASDLTPAAGSTVNFVVSAEGVDECLSEALGYDDSQRVFRYYYTWGDGTTQGFAEEPTGVSQASHTYNTEGTYQASVRVVGVEDASTVEGTVEAISNTLTITVGTGGTGGGTCNPACTAACQVCSGTTCVNSPGTKCTKPPSCDVQSPNNLVTWTSDSCTASGECIFTAQSNSSCGATSTCTNGVCVPDEVAPTGTNTNAVVTAGKIHFCGLNPEVWTPPTGGTNVAIFHELCNITKTYHPTFPEGYTPPEGFTWPGPYTYTCGVDENGFQWFTKNEGIPVMADDPNDPDDAWTKYIEPYIAAAPSGMYPPDILSEGSLTCVNGQLQKAVSKYSPPSDIQEGYCGVSQCYDLETQEDATIQGKCREVGTNSTDGRYICEARYGDPAWADWTSAVVRTAQEMMRWVETGDDYLLNCGPHAYTVNPDIAAVGEVIGYCQLAKIDGDAEPTEIILGLAFKPDQATNQALLMEQLERTHPAADEGLDAWDVTTPTELDDTSFADFDEETGIAYFTSKNSLNSGGAKTGFLTNLIDFLYQTFYTYTHGETTFTDEAGSTTLTVVSKTAEQLYVVHRGGEQRQHAVEYLRLYDTDQQEWRSPKRYIISGNGEVYTYSATRWQRLIQTRTVEYPTTGTDDIILQGAEPLP